MSTKVNQLYIFTKRGVRAKVLLVRAKVLSARDELRAEYFLIYGKIT